MEKNPINKKKTNIILLFLFIIFTLPLIITKEYHYLRKISFNEEIIIYVRGPGEKLILSSDYNYPPDEIDINGNRFEYIFNDNDNKYYFELDKTINIVKLYYNTPPESLKYMFKNVLDILKVDLSSFDTSNVKDMSYMFQNCQNLKEIDMKGIITSNVETMEGMFQSCTILTSLDLSDFDTSSVKSMKQMFYSCSSLEYLNISSFETSEVKDMSSMFSSCLMLKFLDLTNFDIINTNVKGMFTTCFRLVTIKFSERKKIVNDMRDMFKDCKILKSIDLSSFETSNVKDMAFLFNNCYELVYINISSFNTSSVTDFTSMFSYCAKLESLDLSHFDTKNAIYLSGMISYCNQLIYLNLNSFIINENVNADYFFDGVPQSTILCIDEANANTKLLNAISNNNNSCNDSCFSSSNKLLSELRQCVNDCNETDNKLEYNNKCYKNCPDDTVESENGLSCIQNSDFCNGYYNVEKTQCFEIIPNGYFISNETEKIIDKCYEKCKKCEGKGTDDNNNCISCKGQYSLKEGNCIEECQNGFYIDNSLNKKCNCEKNYKCQECPEEDIEGDLCISCKEGYYQILGEKINNLYVNCYEECPSNYSKIIDKNKCIDKCSKSTDYPYEYNNICYKECPKGSPNGDNICIEIEEINTVNTQISLSSETTDFIDKTQIEQNTEQEMKNTETFKNTEIIQNTQIEQNTEKLKSTNIYEQITQIEQIIEKMKSSEIYEQNTQIEQNTEKLKITDIYEQNTQIEQNTEKLKSTEIDEQNTGVEKTEISKNIENTNNSSITQITETIMITSILEKTDIKDRIDITESNVRSNEIIDKWSAEKFFQGLYDKNKSETIKKDDIKKNIDEDIINHNLDPIISDIIKNKEDKNRKEDNALYQITTSDNQNSFTYTNISSIKLGECEKILKDKYNISKNETLIIFKIDYFINGLLIPIIGYEIYHPIYKYKLNLTYCEDSSINYNIPVNINEDEIYKYNPNSEYYNDECNTYTTENGTDILLNDRKDEFADKNMSLCENLCDYKGYDQKNKKALCECGIRYKEFVLSELDNETNLLANNLTLDNKTSNIGVLKCYNTVFSKDGLLKNIGNYVLVIILIIHLVSIIVFYKCGYQVLELYINDIIFEKKKSNKRVKNSSQKTNIFNLKQKLQNKKNSNHIFRKRKKKKKNASPPKKSKKLHKLNKSNGKSIFQENTNISNNNKSLLQLKLKESKIIGSSYKKASKSVKNLIKNLDLNENTKKVNLNSYMDYELNTMEYKEALEIDTRTFGQYYSSLLKTKHPILFAFYPIKDYNVTVMKICIFVLTFAVQFAFNTFFFDFKTIHKVYIDEGNYDLYYLLPQIILSFLIAYVINIIIKLMTLSEKNITEIKKENTLREARAKVKGVERCLIIKNTFYFIISISFIGFFWYYLSSFCAVYPNSQIHLIKNTFISFCLSLLFPFIINIIPVAIRRFSLSDKNSKFIYNMSKFIQWI